MCYDQKWGQLALGGLQCEAVAVAGDGCQQLPSPVAQFCLCQPTAAGLPIPLASCTWVEGVEELQRTCCLALV